MTSKKFSKTMNYLLNYINKFQSESFFVSVSVVIIDYNIISLEPKPNNNLQLIGINKTVV
jgi:hypothetical protein